MKKRYQVYLNPHSVGILDEAVKKSSIFTRSKLIREIADAAATRIGNILAAVVELRPESYSELDKMTDIIELKGRKEVKLSENIDEIYYR